MTKVKPVKRTLPKRSVTNTVTPKDRKKLTDNELHIELKKLWTKGKRGKTNLYELLRTKFKVEKSRTLRMYDVMERIATKEATQGQSEGNVSSNKKAVQLGLKSVLEVDSKLQEIIFNEFDLVTDEKGRVIKVENTTSDKLKAIDIYFKRNGYYMPIKVAQTDSAGNDVEISFIAIKKEEALSKIK